MQKERKEEKKKRTRQGGAVLLLGAELDEHDEPTDEMRGRVRLAAQEYRQGDAGVIVACGGILPGHNRAEADVMADLLCGEGVPSHAVRLEDRSQNTMENIRYAAALLGDVKERRLLVVTSDYHLHRAKATARRLGLCVKGRGVKMPHNASWWVLWLKERCYMIDLRMGWQDEGRKRPEWTRRLFDRIFGSRS